MKYVLIATLAILGCASGNSLTLLGGTVKVPDSPLVQNGDATGQLNVDQPAVVSGNSAGSATLANGVAGISGGLEASHNFDNTDAQSKLDDLQVQVANQTVLDASTLTMQSDSGKNKTVGGTITVLGQSIQPQVGLSAPLPAV